jgi:hypothetical protein
LRERGAIFLLGALIVSADCRFRHFPMNNAQILIHQTGVVVVRRITQLALQPYNRQLDHRAPFASHRCRPSS